VVGIPYDGATTNRPGARFGPTAIRLASHMLCDATHPLFGVSPIGHIDDVGDMSIPNTSIKKVRKAIEKTMSDLLKKNRHVVCFGGDHSITLSLLRELHKKHEKPLAVIHFDAHSDAWSDHFGEPSGHGTWVYEAFEEGLVIPECFVQIGIRSSGEKGDIQFVKKKGGLIFTGRDMRGLETSKQLKVVLDSIRARYSEHKRPSVYLSLDIDCLDPSYAPGTGTPEVGGLSSNQVRY